MNKTNSNRGFCIITGLATCKAEHTLTQSEAALICKEKIISESNLEVYNNTRIKTRNLVIPPDSTPEELKVNPSIPNPYVEKNNYASPLQVEKLDSGLDLTTFPASPPESKTPLNEKSFESQSYGYTGKTIDQLQLDERFNLFEHYSKALIIDASKRALIKANVNPQDIGEVVFVTNTGFHAPHLQQPLFEEVGISEDAVLNNLMGMGCGGGISGLRLGYEHCLANPERIVLLVVVDISSVHTTYRDTKLDVILHAIFSDGCAAAVMKYSKTEIPGKLCIDGQFSKFVPNTKDGIDVTFDAESVKCTLSKNLPNYIKQGLGKYVTDFLKNKHNMTDSEISHWSIHPGGTKILEAVQAAMNLAEDDLQDSWNVLNEYGNMLAPSVLYVMEKLMERLEQSPTSLENQTQHGVAISFSPG
eukprot:Awhi_evm1s143